MPVSSIFASNVVGIAEWVCLVIFLIIPFGLILAMVKHKLLAFLFIFSYIGVCMAILFDWALERRKRDNAG